MPTKWLKINASIRSLRIDDCNIQNISPGAFATDSTSDLSKLVLSNLPLMNLDDGTFKGLTNLQQLIIDHLPLAEIDFEFIATELANLKRIHIHKCIRNNLSILGRLHRSESFDLFEVNFHDNAIRHGINNGSFTGLSKIKILVLYNNAIEVIGPGSFDPILNTLKSLDLRKNRLKTLPIGIFGAMQSTFIIQLDENRWNCDCDLEHLRQISMILPYDQSSQIVCTNPPDIRRTLLVQLPDLCKQPTELENSRGQTTCPEQLTRANKTIQLRETDAETFLWISNFPENYILLAIDNDLSNRNDEKLLNCISNNGGQMKKYRLNVHLKPRRLYRYCMLNKETMNILPLECISYRTMSELTDDFNAENVWIMKDQQKMVFVFVFIVSITFYLFGFYIALQCSHRFK